VLLTLECHADEVQGIAVTADGKRGVSSSHRRLNVRDLDTSRLIATVYIEGALWCCAFADATRVVAGDFGGCVYFLALEE
jgi:hypothetical protein